MVLFYANRPGEPGIILWEVAIAALCFEVLYRSFGVAFRRLACMKGVALDKKRRPTFARDGNSYAVSFVHATIVVVRGFQHLIQMQVAVNRLSYGHQRPKQFCALAVLLVLPGIHNHLRGMLREFL